MIMARPSVNVAACTSSGRVWLAAASTTQAAAASASLRTPDADRRLRPVRRPGDLLGHRELHAEIGQWRQDDSERERVGELTEYRWSQLTLGDVDHRELQRAPDQFCPQLDPGAAPDPGQCCPERRLLPRRPPQ